MASAISAAQGAAGVIDPFFEEHPRMAAILDAEGRILRGNEQLRRTLGFSEDEIAGKGVGDLFAPADQAGMAAALAGLEPGARAARTAATARKDGASLPLCWELVRARDGSCFMTAVEQAPADDAAARAEMLRAKAEGALRREQALLRAVLESAPVVLWAVDRNGIFTLSEGRGLEKLALAPGEVVGQSVYTLFGADGLIADGVRGALRGETIVQTTEIGVTFWDNRQIPLRDESGAIEGMIGLSIDVTERALVERELRGKLALIEEQEIAIRQLSTPILEVWDEVLALPLLGSLDGPRTERILSTLLEAVVAAQARVAILDLTGIATVDAATADYLHKVMRALSLLGTISVMTGIQPGVAQALVSLGVDLSQVITLSNLREAIRFVMRGVPAPRARGGG